LGLAAAAAGDKDAILQCGAALADVGCAATSGAEGGATARGAFGAAVVAAARADGRSAGEDGETFSGNDRKFRGHATTAPDLAARSVQASARSNRINDNKLHTSGTLNVCSLPV
jgi:argininosuccinate synthase